MFSNKENVNILTALLSKHGVHHAVVCPGSRNAPIVHNLNECENITCHPVTDERSAGFYALGMARAIGSYSREPVAVCVTSGSALLNLLPAVAEAYYQHLPLVVISADRPPQWIGQQDGQTIPQPDALGRFVKKAVSLPEPRDKEERWYCNRLVNEALIATCKHGGGPVHINVPISEPLYEFTVAQLPRERVVKARIRQELDAESVAELVGRLAEAQRPLVVIGQMGSTDLANMGYTTPDGKGFVLCEPLSQKHSDGLDELIAVVESDERFVPDFVLYLGGHIVSKRLKQFLRRLDDVEMWQVSSDGEVCDTFMHVGYMMEGALTIGNHVLRSPDGTEGNYYRLWADAYEQVKRQLREQPLAYSAEAVVRRFEQQLGKRDDTVFTHYANSTAVRLGCRYSQRYVCCNRGVNGIEGTLSTAAGFSLTCDLPVFCVIGDLSFFYDSNALWNAELRGNLRIMMLNNGGGEIFKKFHALQQSAARGMIIGEHQTSAEDICRQYRVDYRPARNMHEAEEGLDWLMKGDGDKLPESELGRPMLLEVML